MEKKLKKAELDDLLRLSQGIRSWLNNQETRCLQTRIIPERYIIDVENSGFYFGLETKWGKGYFVGKSDKEDGHVLVQGINGSCKSACIVKPTIETWKSLFVALDVKGELSEHYHMLERKSLVARKSIVFNPSKGEVHYDPYVMLRKEPQRFIQYIREITFAIIPKPIDVRDPYWIDMARNVLSAIIAFGYSKGMDFSVTMLFACRYSSSQICTYIQNSDCAAAKMFINEFDKLKEEQRASVYTEMQSYILIYATDSDIQEAFSRDGEVFSWDIFAGSTDDTPNVFLCFNQDALEQWGGMIRLMITQLIRMLERRPDKHSVDGSKILPLLVLLDEFPLLGKMDVISNALTTLRSKKVTFGLVIQSIPQLDAIYGKDVRKIILDNCQYKVILKVTEPDSQEYLSRMIGNFPTVNKSVSLGSDYEERLYPIGGQLHETREPLVYSHEFAANEDILLYVDGKLFRTLKLPVCVTKKPVWQFDEIILRYTERYKNDN